MADKNDVTKQRLWAIKEAIWELWAEALSQHEIRQLVDRIETDVNTTMRNLGYDPTYIIK